MKTATFVTLGSLPTFSVSESADNYWQERVSYELSAFLRNLSVAGIEATQAESSDFGSFATDMQTALDNYETRFDEILADGVSSVVATLPDVWPIIAALLSGGAEPVIGILLKGVLDAFLRNRNSSLTAAEGEVSPDTSAIVTELENLTAEITVLKGNFAAFGLDGEVSRLIDGIAAVREVLSTININVFRDEESQTYSSGPLPPE